MGGMDNDKGALEPKQTPCYWFTMWRRLNELRVSSHLCDLSLVSADNVVFPVHSVVLASVSKVISSRLAEDKRVRDNIRHKPKKISLPGVLSGTLQVTVDFIYGFIPRNKDEIEKLRSGAKHLDIQIVCELGDKFIEKTGCNKCVIELSTQKTKDVHHLAKRKELNAMEFAVKNDEVNSDNDSVDNDQGGTNSNTDEECENTNIYRNISVEMGWNKEDLSDRQNEHICKSEPSGRNNSQSSFKGAPKKPGKHKDQKERNRPPKITQECLTSDNTHLGRSNDENNEAARCTLLTMDEMRIGTDPEANSENFKIIEKIKRVDEHYKCVAEGCDYKNKKLDIMQSHMYNYHNIGKPNIACPVCPVAHFSYQSLKNHVSRSHGKHPKPASRSKHVLCNDCGEVFSRPMSLKIHQLKDHGKGKLFTCADCEFKSPRKKDMHSHMLSRHNRIPPGVRVFACRFCEYKCVNKSRYEEHEAKHTGEQNYLCPVCGKAYTTRRGMKTHIKYHNNDRPYVCSLCSASFKARGKLYDHVKLLHTQPGLKPYKCSYCPHATTQRGNCKQHIRKSHPGQPVIVIDLKADQRKPSKDYSYKDIEGKHVEVTEDVRAAKWSNIGNAENFAPPPGLKEGYRILEYHVQNCSQNKTEN